MKPQIIFEMANNHQGNLSHGLKIVTEYAALSRDYSIEAAIKLQYRDLETFIANKYRDDNANHYIKRFRSTALKRSEYQKLAAAIKNSGLKLVITPFDEISVERAIQDDVDYLKIASASADDFPLIDATTSSEKPIIVSTGGKVIEQIDDIASYMRHRNVAFSLLHCVSIYPTPRKKLNLNIIDRLRIRYPDVPVGYSGHEDPDDHIPGIIAVSKGATILERHVGVPAENVQLNKYSMSPAQTSSWLESIQLVCDASGSQEISKPGSVVSNNKKIDPDERSSLLELSRGVYAKEKINHGDHLNLESVYFAFPCEEGQMASGSFKPGMIVSGSYQAHEPLREQENGNAKIKLLRKYVHDIRGVLNEVGIALHDDTGIEISHHYGLERFEEFGTSMINVINSHYCKKILVQLPGQVHPTHKHKIKDETFHVLWGELQVIKEGKKINLCPGDKLEIIHNTNHSFSSFKGCVFEEISTTSIAGDSVYESKEIEMLDPIDRKTIIEKW